MDNLKASSALQLEWWRMGTLKAFEDVRPTDDTYDLHHVIKMVTRKDIIGVKGAVRLSMLDDGMSKNVEY